MRSNSTAGGIVYRPDDYIAQEQSPNKPGSQRKHNFEIENVDNFERDED